MRQKVIGLLRSLDAISVENSAYPGTPDVNYMEGWIELKWLRNWPTGSDTPVTIDHFTPQQRVWLTRRWMAGGRSFLLLSCKKEWFLFPGDIAAKYVGRCTYQTLVDTAIGYWDNGIKQEQLLPLLLRYPNVHTR